MMLRTNSKLRRELHRLREEWQNDPTTENPLWARAAWADAALDVPIENDEWPELRDDREQTFRHYAEAALDRRIKL